MPTLNDVGFTTTVSSLPEGFSPANWDAVFAAFAEGLTIGFDEDVAYFKTGTTAPSSLTNVAWLKPEDDRYAWYVPDTSGNWVPLGISTDYKKIYVQSTDPFATAASEDGAMWIQTSGSSILAQKVRVSGAWVTVGLDKTTLDDINTRVTTGLNTDGTIKDDMITSSSAFSSAGLTSIAQAVGAIVWPVGCIFEITGDSRNPNEILGFGTWTAFAAGRVTIGAGTGPDGVTYTDGTTVGANSITLTEAQLPDIEIEAPLISDSDDGQNPIVFGQGTTLVPIVDSKGSTTDQAPLCDTSAWNGEAVDVRQASIVVYKWRRTA